MTTAINIQDAVRLNFEFAKELKYPTAILAAIEPLSPEERAPYVREIIDYWIDEYGEPEREAGRVALANLIIDAIELLPKRTETSDPEIIKALNHAQSWAKDRARYVVRETCRSMAGGIVRILDRTMGDKQLDSKDIKANRIGPKGDLCAVFTKATKKRTAGFNAVEPLVAKSSALYTDGVAPLSTIDENLNDIERRRRTGEVRDNDPTEKEFLTGVKRQLAL